MTWEGILFKLAINVVDLVIDGVGFYTILNLFGFQIKFEYKLHN